MSEQLDYESGVDRAKELRTRWRNIWRKVLVGLGILIIAAPVFGAILLWLASRPEMDHVTLRVVNNTLAPLTDAGLCGIYNERVVAVGPIPIGQFHEISVDFNTNDCLAAFSFDQSGRTEYVPLGKQLVEDGSIYTITLTVGQVTAVYGMPNGAMTTIVQTPSTQPIKY